MIQNPTNISILTFLISFVIFLGIIYLINPSCIQVYNKYTGKQKPSKLLSITCVLIFSSICGIIMLLYATQLREKYSNTYIID